MENKRGFFTRFGARLGCHQLPERSFFYKGKQFPVCARCTGVYIGQMLIAPLLYVFYHSIWLSLLCLGFMLIDWGLQYFKILESNNIRRLITGLMAGYGLMTIYIMFFIWLFKVIINLF